MKKKLFTASVFLFGLGIGGAAAAASSSISGTGGTPGITEEMAECIAACESGGGNHTVCWNCCVRNICLD